MQSNAPDDGQKHRPKHVEPTWNNKLIYIVHLVGYFHSCITMHGFMNVKFRRAIGRERNTTEDTVRIVYKFPIFKLSNTEVTSWPN